jgi:hypothetical protein
MKKQLLNKAKHHKTGEEFNQKQVMGIPIASNKLKLHWAVVKEPEKGTFQTVNVNRKLKKKSVLEGNGG